MKDQIGRNRTRAIGGILFLVIFAFIRSPLSGRLDTWMAFQLGSPSGAWSDFIVYTMYALLGLSVGLIILGGPFRVGKPWLISGCVILLYHYLNVISGALFVAGKSNINTDFFSIIYAGYGGQRFGGMCTCMLLILSGALIARGLCDPDRK